MYILYKLQPRANTTDTVLFAVADNPELLEEYLLSIFDEMVEREIKWANTECNLYDEDIDMGNLIKWCIKRMDEYQIIYVPYLKG